MVANRCWEKVSDDGDFQLQKDFIPLSLVRTPHRVSIRAPNRTEVDPALRVGSSGTTAEPNVGVTGADTSALYRGGAQDVLLGAEVLGTLRWALPTGGGAQG